MKPSLPDPPPGYRAIPPRLNIASEALGNIDGRSLGDRTAFVWDGGRLVRSAPDAVAFVLHKNMHDGAEVTRRDIAAGHAAGSGVQLGMMEGRAAPAARPRPAEGLASSVTCPDCSGFLIFQEGCQRCPECGYNKCE